MSPLYYRTLRLILAGGVAAVLVHRGFPIARATPAPEPCACQSIQIDSSHSPSADTSRRSRKALLRNFCGRPPVNWAKQVLEILGTIVEEPDKFAYQVFRLLLTAHLLAFAWIALFGTFERSEQLAHLEGFIADQKGRGVSVSLEIRPEWGSSFRTVSNSSGAFRLAVPPGTYRVFIIDFCGPHTPLLTVQVGHAESARLPILDVDRCAGHLDGDTILPRSNTHANTVSQRAGGLFSLSATDARSPCVESRSCLRQSCTVSRRGKTSRPDSL